MTSTEWHPLEIFREKPELNIITAILILNQPITRDYETKLKKLWPRSILKFCVDGGANRLHEWSNESLDYLPDYICGDLDSVEPLVEDYYKKQNVKFIKLSSQDFTDFTKTLKFAVNCISRGVVDSDLSDEHNGLTQEFVYKMARVQLEQIYCLSDFTGRLDHGLSNLNTLYDSCLDQVKTYLLSSESLTFLLKKGKNKIHINSVHCGLYCGFFPLGEPAKVTTNGFKWDVIDSELKFGTFISSSNEFLTPGTGFVTIITNQPLLFTMSII